MKAPWQCVFLGLLTGLTPLGTASFAGAQTEPLGGRPAPGAEPSVPDLEYQVKYQRAFEAVLWAVPAVSIHGVGRAIESLGLGPNDVVAYSKPATAHAELLTANNQTPCVTACADLRQGPVVLELPAATEEASLYGQIVDAWQVTVADVGPSGADQGKGGKYLLLPAGHAGEVPAGYLPVETGSMRVYFAFRAVPGPKGNLEQAAAYVRKLRLYPLAEADNPPATRIVDPGTRRLPTLPRHDETHFEDIHDIVSVKPVRARDEVMMGMLASLGIEPGKSFAPDEKTRRAMKPAVVDAYFYMHERFEIPRPELLFWPDRRHVLYFAPDPDRGFTYETDGSLLIDDRAWQYFIGTFYPRRFGPRPAVVYIGPTADDQGRHFVAGATYQITFPKDMPVQQFWSLIVYDEATYAFIYNPLERAGLSSFDLSRMRKNADGGVTIFIGPRPPAGFESNWTPTEGKKPLPCIRLYGPTEAFWSKTFKLPDFERVSTSV